MQAVSTIDDESCGNGHKVMNYLVCVYQEFEVGSKLVEMYHVASSLFVPPKIIAPQGYRVWVSDAGHATERMAKR